MSLWTPDGEHTVKRDSGTEAAASQTTPMPDEPGEPQLSPEQEEAARAMTQELSEARARLLETEASTVITNHALGIYELAAIHLTADAPKFSEAKLAIDALGALVEGTNGRLGEAEPTLTEALHQIRMAYVQRTQQMNDAASDQATN